MLTAPWDFIAEKNIEDARSGFVRTVFHSLADIVAFVDSKLGWKGHGEYDGCFAASFNIIICVRRGDTDERVPIRSCSVTIHAPWRDIGTCPENHFDLIKRFDRAGDYLTARARLLQAHLDAQRNIAGADANTAWRQFLARRCFEKLISKYGIIDDAGLFHIYCDDMRPSKMLLNPDTLEITALLDFEFTNALPAQYAYCVPWWLLLCRTINLLKTMTMEESYNLFIPRKDQFIRAVERVEAQSGMQTGNGRLSVRMRESWDNGRFWFNLASRYCFDI